MLSSRGKLSLVLKAVTGSRKMATRRARRRCEQKCRAGAAARTSEKKCQRPIQSDTSFSSLPTPRPHHIKRQHTRSALNICVNPLLSLAMSTNQIASHFGRSLPLARLTSHDPRLVQVITTPSSHLALGDFGLKSPLRAATAPGTKQGSVRYVQVKEQDRNDVGSAGAGGGSATANWREREHEVMLLRRWEEAGVGIKVGSGEQSNSGSTSSATGAGAGLSYPSSYSSASASSAASSGGGGNAPQAPLPVSRFDRSSRRSLPTDTTIPTIAEDEETALLLSTATSRYSSTPSRLPNYLTLPERDFQRLLEAIRQHRAEFLQGLYTALAERVREDKLQAACEEYDAQEKPAGARPTLQDFSLDEEIATLRRQQGHGTGTGEDADAERLLVDMFDLARSRVASVEASAYLRRFLSARGLDDGNASSTELPDVDVRVNGRRSSADAQDGEAGAGAAKGARLHPLGGLQYGQPDKIFSATLAPALPGRVIGTRGTRSMYGSSSSSSASAKDSSLLIATSSRIFEARKSYAPKLSIYDATGQNTKQGTSLWRLYDARLVNENPSRWSLVERRVADKKAAWDRERGWSLAELGLGYVSASARSVLEEEVERNGFAARFRGKADVNANAGDGAAAAGPAVGAGAGAAAATAAAAAWNRMPGSPAWVGDLSFSENSQAQKDSSRPSYVGRGTSGQSYLGRSRYASPSSANGNNASATAAAAEKHGQLTGQLAAYPSRSANGNGNRVNVSRSAAQRRSGLLGQGQQGEGEGENSEVASFDDDVSSLLGLDGGEGTKRGQ